MITETVGCCTRSPGTSARSQGRGAAPAVRVALAVETDSTPGTTARRVVRRSNRSVWSAVARSAPGGALTSVVRMRLVSAPRSSADMSGNICTIASAPVSSTIASATCTTVRIPPNRFCAGPIVPLARPSFSVAWTGSLLPARPLSACRRSQAGESEKGRVKSERRQFSAGAAEGFGVA